MPVIQDWIPSTTVGRYAAAWVQGDVETMIGAYHDDFVLHYYGANRLAGDHVGKPAALAALGEFTRVSRRKLLRIVDVAVGAERGIIIAEEALWCGDVEHQVERVLVYREAYGLLAECWVYDQDRDLIDRIIGV